MTCRTGLLASVLALLPTVAGAQTLNGSAEWTVARGASVSGDQPYENNNLWQRYTAGFQAPVFDPRFLKFDTEVSFLTNSLTYGGMQALQQGNQSTFGYKLGAVMFPARPFPFFIQVSRDTVGESGDYPSTSGIRGGLVLPAGAALPDFRTRNQSLNIGWQLTLPTLPRVELGYRSGSATITGGPYQAEQDNDELHVGVFKDTPRVRQALRYQRSSFANLATTAFDQRLNDLDYEFGLLIGRRSRMMVHTGRRSSFSLFDLPTQVVDPGTQAYRPPSRGDVRSLYLTTGVTYDPASRLSISMTASADRQDAAPVATSATLATTTARYEVFHGLSVNASGTFGERGQVFNDVPLTVFTRSGQAGSTFRAGPRWLAGTVSYSRGIGSNSTVDGHVGALRSWYEQALLSSSFPSFSVSAGYERQNNEDEILDYGNYDSRRLLGTIQTQGHRITLGGNWEQSFVTRGRGATLAVNHQESFSASATYPLGRNSRIIANGGGFTNRANTGVDRTLFWGGSYESNPRPRLHFAATLRREETMATQTHLDQRGLRGFAQAEYRLRLFSFALEYRNEDQSLQYTQALTPYTYRGHQVLLRITRRFGVKM